MDKSTGRTQGVSYSAINQQDPVQNEATEHCAEHPQEDTDHKQSYQNCAMTVPVDTTCPVIEEEPTITTIDGLPCSRCPCKSKPPFCPPQGIVAEACYALVVLGLLWGAVVAILGQSALPGGHIFALLVLVLASWIGGEIVKPLRLPPLLGMLLVGFALRNVPYVNIATHLDPSLSATLRNVALTIILARAGMGLDASQLRRLSWVCLRLAFGPCLVEATVAGVVSHFFLGLPWLWSFLLGFVLAAVSPAVVVPFMINLQERKLGTAKGIPTLMMASASLDDILAISGFGVLLGMNFSDGPIVTKILQGPLDLVIGIAYGGILGSIAWYLPSKTQGNITFLRVLFMGCGSLFAVFEGRSTGFSGAGALGCLVFAFVAAYGWRKSGEPIVGVTNVFSSLWLIFQPVLFGLIGAEVSLEYLDKQVVGLGLATLCCGLIFRMITSALVVFGCGLTCKEKLFVAVAWLPKATVQAAIGPVALDMVRHKGSDPELEQYGIQVLTVAVLSILLTAPLGAAAISLLAPKLLTTEIEQTKDKDEEGVQVP